MNWDWNKINELIQNDPFNQVKNLQHQGYDPYVNAGQDAMGHLQGQYSQLLNDPQSVMNRLGSGYQQSPGYQFQLQQGTNAINNAAAAGGSLGGTRHQQESGTFANGLANQDYYNYLGNMLNLYGHGLEGYGHLNDQGFQASTGLADNLSANVYNQLQWNEQMKQNERERQAKKHGGLLGGIGMSVGGNFGGPVGAAAGGAVGGALGNYIWG